MLRSVVRFHLAPPEKPWLEALAISPELALIEGIRKVFLVRAVEIPDNRPTKRCDAVRPDHTERSLPSVMGVALAEAAYSYT